MEKFGSCICMILLSCFVISSAHTVMYAMKNSKNEASYFENIEESAFSSSGFRSRHGKRFRRQAVVINTGSNMFDSEAEEVVNYHNQYKSQEGASDMEMLFWNNDLAKLAQQWADGCYFEHGQPNNSASIYSGTVGQNLLATTSSTVTADIGVTLWYNETKDYTYDTGACKAGALCGHYTQLVWSTSREIGCATADCFGTNGLKEKNKVWANGGWYMVCNYGPAGNIVGVKPFKKGPACSKCQSGKFWCEDGLCMPNCTGRYPYCSCVNSCENCGVINGTDCSCNCQYGTGDVNCGRISDVCTGNKGASCNLYPSDYCTNQYKTFMEINCPVTCGFCRDPTKEVGCNSTVPPTLVDTTTQPITTTQTQTTTKSQTPPTTVAPATTVTTSNTQSTATTQKATTTTQKATTTTQKVTTTTQKAATTTQKATTTTAVAADCSNFCSNSGVYSVIPASSSISAACSCSCGTDWQGAQCQNSRIQAEIGVSLLITGATVSNWENIWNSVKQHIVKGVNDHCNLNPHQCCYGAAEKDFNNLVFITEDDVFVGDGYPEQKSSNAIFSVIFVYPMYENALCDAALGTSRKKRQASTNLNLQNALPKEVLHTIVQQLQQNITETLHTCCNATLGDIQEAVVKPIASSSEEPDSNNTTVIIAVCVAMVCLGGIVAVTVAVYCYLGKNKQRKSFPSKKDSFATYILTRQNSAVVYPYEDGCDLGNGCKPRPTSTHLPKK